MALKIEKIIIEQLKNGSHPAFEKVFIAYFKNVRFFIFSFIKSESDSEELAQDVFLKVWENRNEIDAEKSFNSYLYTITRNVVFNYLKHKLVEKSYNEFIYFSRSEFADDPEKILYAREIELLIEMAIGQMPERRREIYCLSRHKGLSNEEIAQKLGISKKTVENQLSLAMSELKKVILFFSLLFIIQ